MEKIPQLNVKTLSKKKITFVTHYNLIDQIVVLIHVTQN